MKIKLLKSMITVLAVMLSLTLTASSSLPRPITGSHQYGVKFTVSGYEGTEAVANLPVLVKISPAAISGFSYSDSMFPSTGEDICFVDMSGNALPFDIDTWNPDGDSYAWVTLPSVQNGTEFVMCYGSDVSGKSLCPDSPWSDYASVWHMESTNPVDQAGDNDGTGTAKLSVVDGVIGSAVSFPGSSGEGVSCGTNLSNADLKNGFTFQSWLNYEVYGDTNYGRAFFGKNLFISARAKNRNSIIITTPGKKDHNFSISSSEDYLGEAGEWFHFAMSFVPGSSGVKLYLNGRLIATQTASGFQDVTTATEMWLGRNQWDSQEFKGIMDESRLSTSVLSAETIAANYAAQLPETFLTVGLVEIFEADESAVLPVFRVAVDEISYTGLSIIATCLNIGEGSSSVTADVQLALDADFNNIVETKRLAFNNTGSETVAFTGLTSGTVYYARVVAVNDSSLEGISDPVSQETYPPIPAFTVDINFDHVYPEFSLSLIRLGVAESVNKVTIQASSTSDFTSIEGSQTFDVNVTEAPTYISGFVVSNIPSSTNQFFRVTVYNDAGYSAIVDVESTMPSLDGNNVWSGLSEDISNPNAYVFEGGLPEAGKTLYFTSPAGKSPIINEDTVMPSLRFTANSSTSYEVDANYNDGYHSSGYDFSGTGVLTFNAEQPIVQASYGTNVINNPILFSRNNNQSVMIQSKGGNDVWLYLNGDLMLPEGVSNTTFRVVQRGNTVLSGNSQAFMGRLNVESGRLSLASPEAMTNISQLYFSGDPASIENLTGKPLVFPRDVYIYVDNSWGGRKVHFYGAPFVFPNGTFELGIRDYNESYFEADVVVSNIVVRKNSSNGNAAFNKKGEGAFVVNGEASWYDPSVESYIAISAGCFAPMTPAGLPPTGEIYFPSDHNWKGTLGLTSDYSPMLDGSSTPRLFQSCNNARWGFTGFGGDRTVCWNNDSSLNLTNTAHDVVSTKLTDTVSTNALGNTYDTYYAYPVRFMFGSRSEFADGTILFMNPIRYELGQNWDTTTYFESTNRVVAARLRGSLKLSGSGRTWYFSGNKFGGYLALEADNSDFTGKINVSEKGNLLVNSPLVAQAVTVQSGSGLGGTGNMATVGGTTIKSGGTLFGGEWNKGGTLTVSGNVTLEANSAIRAEVGASNDLVGCVKLASDSVLKLTAPIYVDVDTDPDISPIRGANIKIVDWSEATFDSGSAPTAENFVARTDSNADIKDITLSVREDGLYLGYKTERIPLGIFIFVK